MTEKNKKIVKRSIEVFNNHNYNSYSNFLAENITWNIVGMPVISGREEYIKTLKTLELQNFSLSNIKNIISEGEFVVVESSSCNNIDAANTNIPAYCDIYRLKNGKIYELTTYIVDATLSNEN